MMNRIIIAIDSFKGCLPSAEANKAAAEGIGQWPNIEVVQIPVSDGGEGWLQAFLNAKGGETVDVTVRDALMRPIVAQYLIQGDTAVVEMARASGLTLLTPEERNPMLTTTYGTGQLVADAVRRGCRNMVVGLGGSATSDCGIGMLRAIIDAFAPGGTWDDVRALNDIHCTIATDVANPLCGSQGAAGYAFLQYLHAECRSGIDLLLDAIGFDALLESADLIITGEGAADSQTLMGKLPFGILQHARRRHVPVCLIAGRIADRQSLLAAGFAHVASINPPTLSLEEAMRPDVSRRNIRTQVEKIVTKRHLLAKK